MGILVAAREASFCVMRRAGVAPLVLSRRRGSAGSGDETVRPLHSKEMTPQIGAAENHARRATGDAVVFALSHAAVFGVIGVIVAFPQSLIQRYESPG